MFFWCPDPVPSLRTPILTQKGFIRVQGVSSVPFLKVKKQLRESSSSKKGHAARELYDRDFNQCIHPKIYKDLPGLPVTVSWAASWAVAVVTSHQANKHPKFTATKGLFLYLILIKLLY